MSEIENIIACDLLANEYKGADFGNYIAKETEKWGKVIRAANIKPQ